MNSITTNMILLYILVYRFTCILASPLDIPTTNSTAAPADTSTEWHLHGAHNFYPCQYQRSSLYAKEDDLVICDAEATQKLGNLLPNIQPDGKLIREIHITFGSGNWRLPSYAFNKIGKDLLKLTLTGGRLRVIKRGAFKGLSELQELNITEAKFPVKNHKLQPGISSRLFTSDGELRQLRNLRKLTLKNVDLSDGLQSYALYDISQHLEELNLIGNNLTIINPYAFEKSECAKSLHKLSIENQPRGAEWLLTANRWARDIGNLITLSLNDNNISNIELNFGLAISSSITELSLEGCSLKNQKTNFLINFQDQLEAVYLGRNKFDISFPPNNSLSGLKYFSKLKLLSLKENEGVIEFMPNWFTESSIRVLDLTKSGLKRIRANELPRGLVELRIGSNRLLEIESNWSKQMAFFSNLSLTNTSLKDVKIDGKNGEWTKALSPLADTLTIVSLSSCELISETLTNATNNVQVAQVNLGLKHLINLDQLTLSNNYLTFISHQAFSSLARLTNLRLNNNNLQTAEEATEHIFNINTTNRRVGEMRLIDLQNNALTSLGRCDRGLGFNEPLEKLLPTSWSNENGVFLRGNAFICDCRLVWLRQYAEQILNKNLLIHSEVRQKLNNGLNFTCVGLNTWTGKSFLQLSETQLHEIAHENCGKQTDTPNDCATIKSSIKSEANEKSSNQPFYLFRPVKVFGYNVEEQKAWFSVQPEALQEAWNNVAKSRQKFLEIQEILSISNSAGISPDVIKELGKNYTVFRFTFWSITEPEKVSDPNAWHVIENWRHRNYIFSAYPVYPKTAYTLCLQNAMVEHFSILSTLCQIFQPSEIASKVNPIQTTPTPTSEKDEPTFPQWMILIISIICVTVVFLFMITACLIVWCVKRKEKQEFAVKRRSGLTPLLPKTDNLSIQKASGSYEILNLYAGSNKSLPSLKTSTIDLSHHSIPKEDLRSMQTLGVSPLPTRRFMRNPHQSPQLGGRTSLLQKIRRSEGPLPKMTLAKVKAQRKGPPMPLQTQRLRREEDFDFERSPNSTVSSPRLPRPFTMLAAEAAAAKSRSNSSNALPQSTGYLTMQPTTPPKSIQHRKIWNEKSDLMADSYILGVTSAVTDWRNEKKEDLPPTPPPKPEKQWKPSSSTVRFVVKNAPIVSAEIDSLDVISLDEGYVMPQA